MSCFSLKKGTDQKATLGSLDRTLGELNLVREEG